MAFFAPPGPPGLERKWHESLTGAEALFKIAHISACATSLIGSRRS
jgi:hypothetical protein